MSEKARRGEKLAQLSAAIADYEAKSA